MGMLSQGLKFRSPHPLGATPQQEMGTYQQAIDRTQKGWMPYVPTALMALGRYKGKLSNRQSQMVNAAKRFMSSHRGSPQQERAMRELSKRWSPQEYRAALSRAGMGDIFDPKNRQYWIQRAYSLPQTSDWITYGLPDYMGRQIKERGVKPYQSIGHMPAYEWQRFFQTGRHGLREYGAQMRKALQESRVKQYGSPLDMIKRLIRGEDIDVNRLTSPVISQIVKALGLPK